MGSVFWVFPDALQVLKLSLQHLLLRAPTFTFPSGCMLCLFLLFCFYLDGIFDPTRDCCENKMLDIFSSPPFPRTSFYLPSTDCWDSEQIDIKLSISSRTSSITGWSRMTISQKGTTFLVVPVTTMLLTLPKHWSLLWYLHRIRNV